MVSLLFSRIRRPNRTRRACGNVDSAARQHSLSSEPRSETVDLDGEAEGQPIRYIDYSSARNLDDTEWYQDIEIHSIDTEELFDWQTAEDDYDAAGTDEFVEQGAGEGIYTVDLGNNWSILSDMRAADRAFDTTFYMMVAEPLEPLSQVDIMRLPGAASDFAWQIEIHERRLEYGPLFRSVLRTPPGRRGSLRTMFPHRSCSMKMEIP
ncbi:hypothetical protein WOLCODRAFT_24501 [Wolfiporia cocos MD-104 SS10]|uniref:Uncharacterized protein n=1 Tax=Wolfiporia cocos (strain MD-104) TaxID=742152 RepID=A0A2H3JQN0_WOLCO|nr:hypothetical protein WOLCODRAFT_24501 [Wolfiporia cocos MD-104 SS10]